MTEVCYWPETIKRWEKEGLPPGTDIYEHFGFDRLFLYNTNDSLRLKTEAVEENEETEVVRDEWGGTVYFQGCARANLGL